MDRRLRAPEFRSLGTHLERMPLQQRSIQPKVSRLVSRLRKPVAVRSRLHPSGVRHRSSAVPASVSSEFVAVRRLSDSVLVAVEGEDARTWLNGQVTNDVRELHEGVATYALVLGPKGRALADLHVFEVDGILSFETGRAGWPRLREHLERYVIMEDVTLVERGLEVLTVVGPDREELVRRAAPDAFGAKVVRTDRLGPTLDVIVSTDRVEETERALLQAATALGGGPLDEAAWEARRIEAGIPRFGVDFGETTYPQEAGLTQRAVSFRKGCYLGQEVVCMLENRGQVSRMLVRLRLGADVAAGAPIRAKDDEVGRVTSVAFPFALGMVRRAHAVAGARLDVGGAEAEVLGLAG